MFSGLFQTELGNGENVLRLNTCEFYGPVSQINGGNAIDTLFVARVSLGADLAVNFNAGNDLVTFFDFQNTSPVVRSGIFNLDTGNNDDEVTIIGPTQFKMNIETGVGQDEVRISNSQILDNLFIGSAEVNELTISGSSFYRETRFRLGSGHDNVNLQDSEFHAPASLETAGGQDDVAIDNCSFTSRFDFLLGSGEDWVFVMDSSGDRSANLIFDGGSQFDDIRSYGGNSFYNRPGIRRFESIIGF